MYASCSSQPQYRPRQRTRNCSITLASGSTPSPGPCGTAIRPSRGWMASCNGLTAESQSQRSTNDSLGMAAMQWIDARSPGPKYAECGTTDTPDAWARAITLRISVTPPTLVMLGCAYVTAPTSNMRVKSEV